MSKGIEYITDSIAICERILYEGDNIPDRLRSQIEDYKGKLDVLKDKVYLKTKKGESDAYAVLESAKLLQEYFEDLKDVCDFLGDFESELSSFITNVEGLQANAKSKSVVIT